MNQTYVYKFVSRVYKRLNDPTFTIKLKNLPGLHGECLQGADTVHLNPKGETVATLVHEMLHDFHHGWSETKVLEYERKIMTRLSQKQIGRLLIALGLALQREEG